ncbi:MAG: HEAT repeat domain-containing protein [bacterium]
MNSTISRISDLLQSPDNMRRCAAAIALGALAPKNAVVVKMLGEALKNANPMLASYILETLEIIGSPASVPYVMPLLDSPDTGTKMRAVAIISKAGDSVVPALKDRLPKVPRAQKIILADLLARIHSRDAFQTLLDLLFDPDFELVKETCEAIRRHAGDLTPKERNLLHNLVMRFTNNSRVKSQERVLTSSLLLLGYVGSLNSRQILFKFASPKMSLYLRRHALIGLKHLNFSPSSTSGVIRHVAPFIVDADEGVVRHSLDILSRLPPSASMTVFWRKHIADKNSVISSFAARQLAASDNPTNNRELLELLRHENPDLREISAAALSAHKGATTLVLDSIMRESDSEVVWRLAKILKSHGVALDRKRLSRLKALVERELRAGTPRREPLLYFLRNSDPRAADTIIRTASDEHIRAKRWDKAAECLRKLISTDDFNDETRYRLSLCNLKLSAKDLSAGFRTEDQALRGFQVLLHGKVFPLLPRLKSEKVLTADDLHYVGFHFAQGTNDDKVFGDLLLQYAESMRPKAKAARKAPQAKRAAGRGK